MKNLVVKDNELLYMRYTELIRISGCGDNAIRFQAFPDCRVIDEDYTLMPKSTDVSITENEGSVTLTCGRLCVKLDADGKLTFYSDGKK